MVYDTQKLLESVEELQNQWTQFLAEQVAKRLSGHPCRVEFRVPHLQRARGVAGRDGDTGLIIVNPALDPNQKLKTFLHEVAHVREHWDILSRDVKQYNSPPRSYKITDRQAFNKKFGAKESEADKLAATWLDYANKNAEDGKLTDKLIALLGMKL